MDHQQEMACGESNGHVIESQDCVLTEVCAQWVLFLFLKWEVKELRLLRPITLSK